MDDKNNHEVWSVESFVADFPWVERFLHEAKLGQTGLFTDASGSFKLEED